MELFSDTFTFLAGVPAIAGLLLTAAAIFLTSDWRLSLTALLVQYVLVGLTLTRFVQAELAIVKILVGVLAVSILYLSGRRFQDASASRENGADGRQFLGMQVACPEAGVGNPLRGVVTEDAQALAADEGEAQVRGPQLG